METSQGAPTTHGTDDNGPGIMPGPLSLHTTYP